MKEESELPPRCLVWREEVSSSVRNDPVLELTVTAWDFAAKYEP
jgi:hypothetical protein